MNKTAFTICTTLLLSACAGQAKVDRQADQQLARPHTTCLKQGLVANTQEHTACVAELYASEQKHRDAKRKILTPPKTAAETEGASSVPALRDRD